MSAIMSAIGLAKAEGPATAEANHRTRSIPQPANAQRFFNVHFSMFNVHLMDALRRIGQ
jgi:hypothetical protein